MLARAAVCFAFSVLAVSGADWNPRAAAQYMDSRQKEWFVWPRANAGAKPCVSCHTGVTYLMARPALREVLGEAGPTEYENGLLASLRSRVGLKEPPAAPGLGVESILAARFLGTADAYDRMWALQVREGATKGSWNWFALDRDPWEMPESRFFGTALAAMTVPVKEHGRPEAQDLVAYLRREQATQPLHNRLMLLWASHTFPEVLTPADRRALIEEIWKKQQPDGTWTMAALGPFQPHAKAPSAPGSNAYATAFTAYVMQQAAGDPANPKLALALAWLRTHQNQECGCWQAVSMNEQYEAGSIPSKFMDDAATAYAVLTLLAEKSASSALPPAY
jgi:squalene-hopene/tetraprenyl-beta-curcumene cyclase